ncbi:MAG TPA: carboxypeptidase regulatory-like domain-containing protein, partial [Anaerolineae bacterium]
SGPSANSPDVTWNLNTLNAGEVGSVSWKALLNCTSVAVTGRVIDTSGAGLAGVAVRLIRLGWLAATAMTGSDGSYAFDVTASQFGDYQVGITLPAGYAPKTPASAIIPINVTSTDGCQVPANFTLQRCNSLGVAASPAQAGSVTVDTAPNCPGGGSGLYDPGTIINLTAMPATGYSFMNWDGLTGNPTANPIAVLMDVPHQVTANFAQCVGIMVSVSPPGSGTATVSPPNCSDGKGYAPGSAVTLTTTPAAGNCFLMWVTDQPAAVFASPTLATTTMTVPSTAVNVAAAYGPCPAAQPAAGAALALAGRQPAASAVTVQPPQVDLAASAPGLSQPLQAVSLAAPSGRSGVLQQPAAGLGPAAPAPPQSVVINRGAYATWQLNTVPQPPIWSNWVINGPQLYLPLLKR